MWCDNFPLLKTQIILFKRKKHMHDMNKNWKEMKTVSAATAGTFAVLTFGSGAFVRAMANASAPDAVTLISAAIPAVCLAITWESVKGYRYAAKQLRLLEAKQNSR